jgi:hypothetical protein
MNEIYYKYKYINIYIVTMNSNTIKKKRCCECNKNVGLYGIHCRCVNTNNELNLFCSKCIHTKINNEKGGHVCKFNYKEHQKNFLEIANEKIQSIKVSSI